MGESTDYSRDLKIEIPESRYKTASTIHFDITLVNERTSNISGEDYKLLIFYPDNALPPDFSTLWSDVNSKFISTESHVVTLSTGNSADYSFSLNQSLTFRKVRLLLVKPDELGTSISDKIISEENIFDHANLYPYSSENTSLTFRIKE